MLKSGSYVQQAQSQQRSLPAHSQLEHVCKFDIDRVPSFVRHTSVVCTAGEKWLEGDFLETMILNGMNILRLNVTLASKEFYKKLISKTREIEEKLEFNPSVGIALDITAPMVRTGFFHGKLDEEIYLKDGSFVNLTVNPDFKDKSDDQNIWINLVEFPTFIDVLRVNDRIFVDDGSIWLIVKEINIDNVRCMVETGGELGGARRVQLQRHKVYTKETEKSYINDLLFAKENNIDMVFTSHAENAAMIQQAKCVLGPDIKVLAKIESRSSVNNLNEILAASDGIIIGRGDLGLEYHPEKIFKLQKSIIARSNVIQKPVMVITQMLESMCYKPRATRAEVGDVANAVLDGADGLILSVETSKGRFPLEALKVMHQTCREAETAVYHSKVQLELKNVRDRQCLFTFEPTKITALAAVEAATNISASSILVPTITGRSAVEIAAYRPCCPVLAIVRRPEVARQLHLYRGIHPFVYRMAKLDDWSKDMDERLNAALTLIRQRKFADEGDNIVVVNGWHATAGTTNTVRILSMPSEGEKVTVLTQHVSGLLTSSAHDK